MPLISVIMSVYNSERYLKESTESVLAQSFKDFEFLIVDDCSSDDSYQLLQEFAANDGRIKLFKNDKNLGLTKNLNRMIKLASGKYIARMDSDDICCIERFQKQIALLERDNSIGVCGTFINTMEKNRSEQLKEFPVKHEEIIANMFFENPIAHPTVMIRSEILKNIFYNEDFRIMQDYEFWVQLSQITKFENIPEALVFYRILDNSITKSTQKKMDYRGIFTKEIYLKQIVAFDSNIEDVDNKANLHLLFAFSRSNNSLENLYACEKWLKKLQDTNNRNGKYKKEYFNPLLSKYWFKLCTKSTSLGLTAVFIYRKSNFSKNYRIAYLLKLRFILKALFRYKV